MNLRWLVGWFRNVAFGEDIHVCVMCGRLLWFRTLVCSTSCLHDLTSPPEVPSPRLPEAKP